MTASELLTPAPFGKYLLHHVTEQMTALYDEFSKAHTAVLYVPPAAEMKYEDRMLDIAKRIRQAGPDVAIIVRPNMNRQSDRATWVGMTWVVGCCAGVLRICFSPGIGGQNLQVIPARHW